MLEIKTIEVIVRPTKNKQCPRVNASDMICIRGEVAIQTPPIYQFSIPLTSLRSYLVIHRPVNHMSTDQAQSTFSI